MTSRREISEALEHIFCGINRLATAFPNRSFTIDGRLVGDVGEIIAALEYELTIDDVSRPTHDGITSGKRNVQVKATFKDSLTFKTVPELYLGFKLYPNGDFDEIYNGPGSLIFDRYSHRKGIGSALLSFPIAELRQLSAQVPDYLRVPKRAG
jgi:hypothetical protein